MNNNFDKKIKEKINKNPMTIPQNLDDRINNIIASFEDNSNQINMKMQNIVKKKRVLVLAAIIMCAVMTAFISQHIVEMTYNLIGFFQNSKDVKFLSKKEEFEKYNGVINSETDDKGIELKITNIAVDDSNIIVAFTVRSNEPITELLEYYDNQLFVLEPTFTLDIDSRGPKLYDKDSESYLIDDYSFSVIQKYMVTDTIPDEFQLNLKIFHDLLDKEGDWSFSFNIDKSSTSENSITVMPGIEKDINLSVDNEVITYSIAVKKVSFSPLGAQMVIETDVPDFVDFAIRDEHGNYFPIIYNGGISQGLNTIEFICLNENASELNLIPVISDNRVEKVLDFGIGCILPDKIKLSELGGYTIENIFLDNNELKIEFKPYGIILPGKSIINNALAVIDESGKDIITFGNPDYNKKTGTIILSSAYEGTEDELKEKLKGFRHIYISDIIAEENQAITINMK